MTKPIKPTTKFLKIETLPLPDSALTSQALQSLAVGQSFLSPSLSPANARYHAKRLGIAIMSRKEADGRRFWRIK